ncbi:uncharacterized protein LOC143305610 [Osmia lignaria lignaria]|uniref:uncharacterized protein LOC143305610 n=1 Tax=Osmia lignaria lignaria TaxID=1437193 RepID=UPI00402B31BD
MSGDKKKKGSRSRSRERNRKKQKTDERFEKIENQINNLTKVISQLAELNKAADGKNLNQSADKNLDKENVDTSNLTQPQEAEEPLDIASTEDREIPANKTPINEVMLEMLGEHPDTKKEIPIKINEELKIRWQRWMQEGYPEDKKKNILETYPRKDDFYTEAPKVNIEIGPVMTEIALKRDEHFAETQNCIGSAISALGAAVSMILEEPEDGIDQEALMKYLCDTGKLLTDVFHQQSKARRAFITPLMNKSVKPTVDATKADEWLYGKKFAEQVKEAKTINPKSRDQGNSKYPPAKYKQVGNQQKKSVIRFKSRPQRTNYSTTKASSRTASHRLPPRK